MSIDFTFRRRLDAQDVMMQFSLVKLDDPEATEAFSRTTKT